MSDFPYPGLRPFRWDEVDIFFGREEQVDQLLEKLGQTRFLSVVGPSGCGKSSLVRAGMLNALETGFLADAGARWRIANMRPGNCPMRNLAKALLKESSLGPERGDDDDSAAFLLATLRRGPLGLVEALHETPLPKATNLLILVDQFEEIFRYRQQFSVDEAEAFVALLLASTEKRDVPLYVVITMRSDFLVDCGFFRGLPEAMNEGQYITPHLSREQRRAAIVGPAEVFDGRVEPILVNKILNDMGADSGQLPLMQHALMRMWKEASKRKGTITLTMDDYEAIGGLERALSSHADEAFGELNEEQKRIAEVLFRRLSERSAGRRDTRRPTELFEIAAVARVSPEEAAAVIELFRKPDRSFLTPPAGTPLSPKTIIDISHESLISKWERLNKWVEEEADSSDTYSRLEQTARLWKEGKAALWGTPDLEIALAWEENQQPTREWAKRYGKNFELAMAFLHESENQREEQKKREEEAHQHELKQVKKRLALALVGLLIALGFAVWASWERKQRTLTLFESYLTHASLLAQKGNYQEARDTLDQSHELDLYVSEKRRHARELMTWFVDLMGGKADRIYEGADVPLFEVVASPNGQLLAAVGERGTIVLFDTQNGELLGKKSLKHDDKDIWILRVALHPDGKRLITAGQDRRIIFWGLYGEKRLKKLGEDWHTPDDVFALAINPSGTILATGGADHMVTLWDGETGKVLKILKEHSGDIWDLAFSPDGKLLASASSDNTAIIWNVETGEPSGILRGHSEQVNDIAFHPNAEILASSSADKTIRLWDIKSGKSTGVLQGHTSSVYGLTFTNFGSHIISSSRDGTLRVWDRDLGITMQVFQGHTASVNRIAAIGNKLFSTSNDRTLRQWSIHPKGTRKKMRIFNLPGKPSSCSISTDCSAVAVGFCDGALRLYTLPDARLMWEEKHKAHTTEIKSLAFSPDGHYLVSACLNYDPLILWRVIDGKPEQTFVGHTAGIWEATFSSDGRQLAAAGSNGQICLYEIGKRKGKFYDKAHEGGVRSVDFDKNGQRLLSAGEDGKVRLWDIESWPPTLLQDFPKSAKECRDKLYCAAFCPGNNRFAVVGRYPIVDILKINVDNEDRELVGHEGNINRVIFSLDGGLVATVSGDATIRLWDLYRGGELFTLHLPAGGRYASLLMDLDLDFDFHCAPMSSTGSGGCWIVVPLPMNQDKGKLILYNLGHIYD